MWLRRKKALAPEEEYIAKLNREAWERELHPPTHHGVVYLSPGHSLVSMISTDKIYRK